MSGAFHLDRHGEHVALIRIDRPEARNALTPRMLCALADAFLAVRDDAEVRAVVLTGTGDVAFCAGGDLGLTLPLMTGARARRRTSLIGACWTTRARWRRRRCAASTSSNPRSAPSTAPAWRPDSS